jgi:hypothetical protein
MAQARREREFALGDIESRISIRQTAVAKTSDILERRIAHCGVIAIET